MLNRLPTIALLILLPFSPPIYGQFFYSPPPVKIINFPAKQEVRINWLISVRGNIEVNYERFLSENRGWGIAASISVDNNPNKIIRNLLLPYYRMYFNEAFASGFFIEANIGVAREYYRTSYAIGINGYDYTYQYQTTIGLGSCIGYKMVGTKGWTGEYYLGFGRLYGNSSAIYYPRVGICFGKRG